MNTTSNGRGPGWSATVLINRIEGCTRVLGKEQGYLGLPIRDMIIEEQPIMFSSWTPTPAELARLNAGASIYLSILGTQHPPVMLSVGEQP